VLPRLGTRVAERQRSVAQRASGVGLSVGVAGVVAVFALRVLVPTLGPWALPNQLQDLLTLSISVIVESFPFVILGIVLSIAVQVWIPDRWIMRVLPDSPFLRRAVISFLGIFLPVCERGNVPLPGG
jgi:uncharacterized membrane protein YraQ (UPF0718 family)